MHEGDGSAVITQGLPDEIEEDGWSDDDKDGDPPIDLSLNVAPSMDIAEEGMDCHAVVSIQVPDCTQRAPTDVCCVVDISASMKSKATYENEAEEVVDGGLTCLDIVKHAVKCVAHMLRDVDRLALVAYNDTASTISPLLPMTCNGREDAIAALDSLRPALGTNIWAGVAEGLEALQAPHSNGTIRQKSLLLLTDGRDGHQHRAQGGHVAVLRNYKEKHTGFDFQLNTFGFGYNLDSKLLLDLAMEGQGTFAFIPDALIVGTCFVNCIANVLSTQTQDATLHLTAQGGAQLMDKIVGVPDQMVTEASWGRVVNLGPLQFGQSRDVVVNMHIPGGTMPYLESVVVWRSPRGIEQRASAQASIRRASSVAVAALARSDTVRVGYEAIRDGETVGIGAQCGREKVLALHERIARGETTGQPDENVTTLKADVAGRMSKALLGQERFQRWGAHYLRSLMRSHQLQLCTNFMDAGLQGYGGALFKALRAEGDEIFLSLPPPTASAANNTNSKKNGGERRRRRRQQETQARQVTPAVVAPRQVVPAVVAPQAKAAPAKAPQPEMAVYYGGAGGG